MQDEYQVPDGSITPPLLILVSGVPNSGKGNLAQFLYEKLTKEDLH